MHLIVILQYIRLLFMMRFRNVNFWFVKLLLPTCSFCQYYLMLFFLMPDLFDVRYIFLIVVGGVSIRTQPEAYKGINRVKHQTQKRQTWHDSYLTPFLILTDHKLDKFEIARATLASYFMARVWRPSKRMRELGPFGEQSRRAAPRERQN